MTDDKAGHSVSVTTCLLRLAFADPTTLSGNHAQHTDHPVGAARQCFEEGMVLIWVVTGHSPQSFSNIPWDTAGELKMQMLCNLRGQEENKALIQSQSEAWCCLPPPSVTVSPQALTLAKVGQGKPALRCPLLL